MIAKLLCAILGHRITGTAWIASKNHHESYCSRCRRNLVEERAA